MLLLLPAAQTYAAAADSAAAAAAAAAGPIVMCREKMYMYRFVAASSVLGSNSQGFGSSSACLPKYLI